MITDLEEITAENFLKIKVAHWNIEMQHWLLDIQLREDEKTSRKGAAITNGGSTAFLPDGQELDKKPMKRFLIANEHDAKRIETLLFGSLCFKKEWTEMKSNHEAGLSAGEKALNFSFPYPHPHPLYVHTAQFRLGLCDCPNSS